MAEATPLDAAHAAMAAAPGEEAAERAFYARLAASELHLLLEAEPAGGDVAPALLELAAGQAVAAFDLPARLAAFAGGPAAHVTLPGRDLAAMLAGRGLSLALNPGGAGAAALLAPDAVDWLAEVSAERAAETAARPQEVFAPAGFPEAALAALDARLALAEGLADHAWLARARYADGAKAYLLAFAGAAAGAETALADAVGEALRFTGLDLGPLDIAFFAAGDPALDRLARVALRLDLPRPAPPAKTDPGGPPKLR